MFLSVAVRCTRKRAYPGSECQKVSISVGVGISVKVTRAMGVHKRGCSAEMSTRRGRGRGQYPPPWAYSDVVSPADRLRDTRHGTLLVSWYACRGGARSPYAAASP